MFYAFYELQRSLLSPLVVAANVLKENANSPFNLMRDLHFTRDMGTNSELFTWLMRGHQKPEWDIDTILVCCKKVVIDAEVVLDKPFCKLIQNIWLQKV
jgi:poly(3-hydroxybutyrate) depolymerase